MYVYDENGVDRSFHDITGIICDSIINDDKRILYDILYMNFVDIMPNDLIKIINNYTYECKIIAERIQPEYVVPYYCSTLNFLLMADGSAVLRYPN